MQSESGDSYDPSQELRFAVVLYGGVSLAIYINGVAQELLRLVRSTADLPAGAELKGTELVYRELGRLLYHGRTPGQDGADSPEPSEDRPRTRFVVDILSGSSAGGINGVFLAKALATKAKNLDLLKNMWMKEADLETLLNDEKSDFQRFPSGDQRASLLNSERMYGLLYEALERMNASELVDAGAGAFADRIDLFVTATDLNGLPAPVQLSDRQADEKKHKVVFHFSYEDPNLPPASKLAPPRENELTSHFDPMLAFAARCTSSFPVAFEPMSFAKIRREIERRQITLADATERYRRFFPAFTQAGTSFVNRPLADGGYLDNKPFSYAIQQMEHRSSRRPVARKLLYVDPFPEYTSDYRVRERINFIANAQLAAMGLPRYETIRGDLDAVNAGNRRQRRLRAWRGRIENDYLKRYQTERAPSWRNLREKGSFENLDLADMVGEYDIWYAQYHHIRVYDVTDSIATLATRLANFNPDSDQYYAMRLLAKAWRDEHFTSYRTDDKGTENRYLLYFDIDFRMRLADQMSVWIDGQLPAPPEGVDVSAMRGARVLFSAQLRLMQRVRELLSSPLTSPLRDAMAALLAEVSWEEFSGILREMDQNEAYKEAGRVYQAHKTAIDNFMSALDGQLREAFGEMSRDVHSLFGDASSSAFEDQLARIETKYQCAFQAFLAGPSRDWLMELKEEYESFDYQDMLTLTFLDGSSAKEHTDVEVYRVSPADSDLRMNGKRGDEKLAGTAVMNFGAFLDRRWRENDIMWGRLDGAEQLVRAMLPDEKDQPLRDSYVERLRDVILTEELDTASTDRVYQWLAEQLREKVTPRTGSDELLAVSQDMLKNSFPMLSQMINQQEFEKFIRAYYTLPAGPEPKTSLGWISRASKILGKMIDDLSVGSGERPNVLARVLQSTGVLLMHGVRFATPNTIWERLRFHWLWLIALAGVILVVAAPLLGQAGIAYAGYTALAVCLGLAVTLRALGRILAGEHWFGGLVRFVVVAALGLLFGVGAYTAFRWIGEHWSLWTE